MFRLAVPLCVIVYLGISTVKAQSDVGTAVPPIVKSEFIFETAPFKSCHASTIVETKMGLVAAWFGGTAESHPDVGIWLSRQIDGQWTAPVEVVNGIETAEIRYACWNPVLFQPKAGPLLLFYKVGTTPKTWWGMLVTSEDSGKTWSKPTRLADGILGPVKNKPIQFSNGDILSGSSTEHDGWRVHFERSTDGGHTWQSTGVVNDGTIASIQPSILIHKDGRLQAIGRTRQGKVFEISSRDNGRTWGKMRLTTLPNPGSGTDAVTLVNGQHVIIDNHTSRGRSPLNVAVSADGEHWGAVVVLENTPGEYSYPAVIQTSDDLIHFVYTWNRQRIKHVVADPKAFKPRLIVDGTWPE